MKEKIILLTGIYIIIASLIIIYLTWFGIAFNAGNSFGLGLIMMLIACLPFYLGVGIIKRNNKARISLIVLSVISLLSAPIIILPYLAIMLGKDIIIDKVKESGMVQTEQLVEHFMSMAIIEFVFFMIIPIFFLVFFNYPSVKEMFLKPSEGRQK